MAPVSTATDAYFLVRATCLTPAAAIESHAPVPHLEEHAGGEAELASAPGGAEEVVGDEERGAGGGTRGRQGQAVAVPRPRPASPSPRRTSPTS